MRRCRAYSTSCIPAPGVLRPACRTFAEALAAFGAEEFARRREQAARLVHENGLMYNAVGDVGQTVRPWDLDIFPVADRAPTNGAASARRWYNAPSC